MADAPQLFTEGSGEPEQGCEQGSDALHWSFIDLFVLYLIDNSGAREWSEGKT